jgi:hypothetical protein
MPPKKKEVLDGDPLSEFVGCSLKELSPDLLMQSAEIAFSENPSNRPDPEQVRRMLRDASSEVDLPQAIAVLTKKYWGKKGVKLGVFFMDTADTGLKAKILAYMNRWRTGNPKGASITFLEASRGMAQVRIARENSGYWSYLGTDILQIPVDQATMNLQGFTLNTRESEYARVVTHETGHTLGFPHEHMRQALVNRLDRQKTIAYFMQTQGWDEQDVIQQVLSPLNETNLIATEADQTSIMTYQLPGSITKDGKPIPGGADINAIDYAFVSEIYPPATPITPPPTGEKARVVLEYDEVTNKFTIVS